MESASALVVLYENIDLFLFIFVRMIGLFVILPVFTGQNIPMTVRISVAAGIAMLSAMNGQIPDPVYTESVLGLVILLVQEFMTGFIIGFTVYLLFAIFYFVGQMVDYQIGFSMVSVYDPVSQIQAPITGNLYYLIICAFFIITGGLHILLYEVVASFQIIPIGGAHVLTNSTLMSYLVGMMVDYLVIGVKIAMPVVGAIIVVDVALGVLVKAAPQMNVFVVGMPIKVFIGLVVLMITIAAVPDVYAYVYNVMMKYVTNIIRGLAP